MNTPAPVVAPGTTEFTVIRRVELLGEHLDEVAAGEPASAVHGEARSASRVVLEDTTMIRAPSATVRAACRRVRNVPLVLVANSASYWSSV